MQKCSSLLVMGALILVLAVPGATQATGAGSGVGTSRPGQATPGLGSGREGGGLGSGAPTIADPAAQDGGGATSGTSTTREGTYDRGGTMPRNEGSPLGLLGLLGLAGLAGLLRRPAAQNQDGAAARNRERGTAMWRLTG